MILKTLLFVLVLLPIAVYGQDNKIQSRMMIVGDSVFLRWAPLNSKVWQEGNKSGYKVERFEIASKLDTMKKPVGLLLTPNPILPYGLEMLDSIGEEDEYPAIVLKAIHEGSFAPVSPLVNHKAYKDFAQELQSRFSFSLLAADLSASAAKAHGLSFTDIIPDSNKRYAYKISLLDTTLKVDPSVIIYEKQRKKEPILPLINILYGNHIAILSWDKLELEYSGYIVEKSADKGKTFQRINHVPIVAIDNADQPNKVFFKDSLTANDIEYQYRVKGITCFGRFGPSSNVVKGMGIADFTVLAHIDSIASLPNQTVYITWSIDKKDEPAVSGFDIMRSDSILGEWKNLNKSVLKSAQRHFTDLHPINYGYYKIKTYGTKGGSTFSFIRIGMVIDSIPPQIPQNIKGYIEKNGKVSLLWSRPQDKDLQGYRIFRGNNKGEVIEITKSLCDKETFTDSIDNRLSPSVYYRLASVDLNFNRSELSEPMRLMRPDTIPPAPALITKLKANDDTISFVWLPSPSPDVSSYRLLRIGDVNKDTVKAKTWKSAEVNDENLLIDLKAPNGTQIHYELITTDAAGNQTTTRSGTISSGNGMLPPVEKIKVVADRKNKCIWLAWEYPSQNIRQYTIYRAQNGEKPVSIAIVEGKINSYKDTFVFPNNEYQYFLQAEGNNFMLSKIVKDIVIKY